MREPLPLATTQDAILFPFLPGHDDAVLYGVAATRETQAGIDRADLYRLLLTFPDLKIAEGPVAERLRAVDAFAEVMAAWKELVAQEILPEDDAAEFE